MHSVLHALIICFSGFVNSIDTYLRFECLNFDLKSFILVHLAPQETVGNSGFFGQASWGEHVDIAELVLGISKVFHFYQTLFHQRFQAIIQTAHADIQFHGQFALGEVRVFLQDAHDPEICVFL